MRKHKLLTATALNLTMGLVALAGANGQAFAATTISTATTTPVKTSVTGDLTVATTGSIAVTSGSAITVDSNNSVTLNGKIDMLKSADGATGILIDGGHTGNLTISANITVTDDWTQPDTNLDADGKAKPDGILEAPFSDGKTRYGIHSTGTTPFIGNVSVNNASAIAVDGNNSYGIRFENKVQGTFVMDGAITMNGDNNTGVSLENGATGAVYLSGSITSHGKDSSAVKLAGDFADNVIIDGTYTGTGYATTSALGADALKIVLATPADLYQSGPLVSIEGNLAHGLLIGSTVVADTSDANKANVDQDGDGNPDANQQTAALTNYGSAAALRVGSATDNITLGGVVFNSSVLPANKPAINYGLLIRGAVNGYGVYQGVNSTGVQLGGTGHAVNIANGIGIAGTVASTAFGGNATALSVQSGLDTPLLDVTGVIRGTAASATTLASTDADGTKHYTTVGNTTAAGVDILAGAKLPKITVAAGGGIYAAATGSTEHAVAIRDLSGTLTTINNNNIISATIAASDDNVDGIADTIVNRGIAIDVRANTSGVTITQTDTAPTDSDADKAIPAPFIQGDILLGSGNDSIIANGGLISGNVDFGAGANSFKLDGSAVYIGKMSGAGTVALDITKGGLYLTSGTALNLSKLHVGAESTLALTLDTANPTVPVFTNSGTAVFDDGASVSLSLNKLIVNPTVFTIMTASNIDLGTLDSASLDGKIPYLYHADLTTNAGDTTLYANFRLKNQAEAQYSDNQYTALAPVLSAIGQDTAATGILMSQLTKEGFDQIYNQYLPDYSGENLLSLATGAASLNRTLSSLTIVPDNDQGQWWLQEYGYQVKRKYGETAGFKSTGFSFAGGREREVYGNQMLGLYMVYTSGSPLDTFAIAGENMVNSDVTLGGYWRIRTGGLKAWAHAGAGYTSFETARNILATNTSGTSNVNHISKAKWGGYSYSGGAGASYEVKAGRLSFTPQVLTDYYALSEEAHAETGGGDQFDLSIGERDSHLLTASALFNVSYNKFFAKPEIWLGYKQNVSAEIADTTANFKGATPFMLNGGDIEGGGPVAGFRISADNQYSYFSLEGEYEKKDDYTNYSVSLRTRFQF
ncbi:autotransporter outer membrane beta-barrel domain-containing protein [Asticcacaulis sp.]|uniref:autotransporter outer membrane beta-barrel domain-containing protein n=1 Tax=Asticcacaulis sp. TaxID=1872648 RepID=UPI002CFB45DD|nr:autotransporter outer membrane beta-barrel domain-containing protein [Asticcacaulis sp.]HTM82350.1 autotransporter outer membrane beta-barrel domain-containing protein [Asticcacaulis sp.]